jgi:2'-5' RNA ligase
VQKCKYFIAIIPESSLSSEIYLFRKKYLDGLNMNNEHKKFPHITLQHPFSREEGIENEIRSYLNTLAENFHPFEIRLSGVSHFDHRVIFIGVEENPVLMQLHQELKEMLMKELKFNSEEVSVEYHPHITLEKKITKADFNLFWKKIQDEKFEGSFQCSSFFLMKHNGRVWEEAEKFKFNYK